MRIKSSRSIQKYSINELSIVDSFIDKNDREILFRSINSWKKLILIGFPPLLSVFFCPFTLLASSKITEFFWPPELFSKRPNINDAISCYLTPSGLVYAIAFGFSFQEALNRQTIISNLVAKQSELIDQISVILENLKFLDPIRKMRILLWMKNVSINWLRKVYSINNNLSHEQDTNLNIVMRTLNDNNAINDKERLLLENLYKKIFSLESITKDRSGEIDKRIPILQ